MAHSASARMNSMTQPYTPKMTQEKNMNSKNKELINALLDEAEQICTGNDVERIPEARAFLQVFGDLREEQ